MAILVALINPDVVNPYTHLQNSMLLSNPILLILVVVIFSTIITTITYVIIYCLDQPKWYYAIPALILGGAVYTLILIVVRGIYHKLNFRFFS
jgi:high-affinity K+ transport system ATPase subunit B